MDNINIHFSGNVNININLPEDGGWKDPDNENYRKLVKSLEGYLHDAADELGTEPDEVDSIVMVMRPGQAPDIMLDSECFNTVESRGRFDHAETIFAPNLDVDGLLIAYDDRHVLQLGDDRYLLGPAIVYACDKDGDGVSLTPDAVMAAIVYFENHTVTLWADGEDLPSFAL